MPTPLASQLDAVIAFLNEQGWTPATSSNFSARLPEDNRFLISRSGIDKAAFTANDFMTVDENATAIDPPDARPSAEVLLHRAVYRCFPQANVVLHTHSVPGVVLSTLMKNEAGFTLHGFEILKAFEGVRSHEETLWLPLFPNSQDMAALSNEVELVLRSSLDGDEPLRFAPGFVLAGHGLYAWGDTPAQAKRHIEAFEYLFRCLLALRTYGNPIHP